MPPFKKTNTKIYSKTPKHDSPETEFWKQFSLREPVLIKELSAIEYIDFSPREPHHFAVTTSAKVQIYNPITKQVQKNFNKFMKKAYGGNFRADGLLLCAGSEESQVKIFNVASLPLTRLLKGHKAPVHRCFFTSESTKIASFSDDKTVALWDIASESPVLTYEEHKDYVRSGAVSPVSANILLSGGYDNFVKMYDIRQKSVALTVDHGAPVESVIFFPSGGIFCTAGGNDVKVWDSLAGGRLLTKLTNHHKTCTCITVTKDGKNLLSGGLDRQVKIYELSNFEVVHTVSYPNSILSLDVSPNKETLAVGMVDGLLSVIKREFINKVEPKPKSVPKYLKNAPEHKVSKVADIKVLASKPALYSKYEYHFKKFEYSKALDVVLKPYVTSKNPEITVSLFHQLFLRDGLKRAIVGRDENSLLSLLKFLNKNIGIHSFSRILIDVAHTFLDIYEDNCNSLSPNVRRQLELISTKVQEEEKLTKLLLNLQGGLELLFSVNLRNVPTIATEPKEIVNLV